jgi:ankyrin repeat protein
MKLIFFLLALSLTSLQAEVTAEQMFVKATKDGDLQTIETLLSVGFNPSLPVHGYTPLYFAIQFNRTDIVDLLLAGHADPNALVMSGVQFNRYGGNATPLQLAVLLGNERQASILIAAGAHVDAKGTTGRTPLDYAVRDGHLEMIHFLIEKGADVNARDGEGASPLDDAVWQGSLDTVAILLAHGGRVNEPETQTGATPINEAAFMGKTEIVRYLLQFHPDLGIPDKRGYGPLDNAIRMRKEDAAQLLLEAEPKEHQTAQFLGKTMEAATQKDESVTVAALLRHGALANDLLPSGASLLDVAAFGGAGKVVRLLLDNGADPNLSGRNGATPLEDASLKGFDSIVSMLLDHGALVNQLNSGSGTTALYAAASFGKGAVVKLLLSRGANPLLCGNNRKSPYQAAVDNGYSEVATEIRNHGGAGRCEQ